MAIEVTMPSLGEGIFEGKIASWLKKEGDRVRQYEPILEIETDKVTTEATAEVAGTLLKIAVQEGETVEVGTVLALIGEKGEEIDLREVGDESVSERVSNEGEAQPATRPSIARVREVESSYDDRPARSEPKSYTGRISPVVGRIAEEHGVDLGLVPGTGRDGRITKKDILAYIERREETKRERELEDAPAAATTPEMQVIRDKPAPTLAAGQVLPHTSIRRSIAEHMVRSKKTSPHVTTIFDVDFQSVFAHRQANKANFARDGVNLTYTAYIVSAIVLALKNHPLVNSSWDDNGIIVKKEINVGVATAIPDGLIVPVVKNADSYSLLGLARSINDLAERARNNKLRPDEVQGGTFTLTNHGVFGSLFATPIINQPQCAILGMGKIEKRVKVVDDAIAIRPMAYAGLTFDHRILDGASADGFMSELKAQLEHWN